MNAAKSSATRKDIGRRAGLASGKARAKTAKLKEQLMAELYDVIVNNCYDAPFELTKRGRMLSLDGRNRLVASGRTAGENNIHRLPNDPKFENGERSKVEVGFYEEVKDLGFNITSNEHQRSVGGIDRILPAPSAASRVFGATRGGNLVETQPERHFDRKSGWF